MSFLNICVVLNTLCVLVYGYTLDGNKLISVDYYGSGSLRHTRIKFNCDLDLHKEYCRFKCSKSPAVCIGGNCYCVKSDKDVTGLQNSEDISTKESIEVKPHSKNYALDVNNDLNNNRRHHIAHFCPDLELARKCIRKCMAKGKPAFCGKDHVCYCSHNTKRPGMDKELNVTAMYSQFKDLYDKYFGTNQKESKETKDYNNDIVDTGSGAADQGAIEDTEKMDNQADTQNEEGAENQADTENQGDAENQADAENLGDAANQGDAENQGDTDNQANAENQEGAANQENAENPGDAANPGDVETPADTDNQANAEYQEGAENQENAENA